MSGLREGAFVQLWLDDAKVGCGWRCFLVLSVGRKWTHLFYPAANETVSIPNGSVAADKVVPVKLRKGFLLRTIRDNANRKGASRASKEAIALIKAQ